jgi:Bacterial shufflon protein, N-terminal constant region
MRFQAIDDAGSGGGSIFDIGRTTNNVSYLKVGNVSTPALFVDAAAGNVGVGTTTPNSKLEVAGGNLGGAVDDTVELARFSSGDGNTGFLDVRNVRTSAGATWISRGNRIQEKIDSTWMGYLQFNGNGNDGGISFGTGTTTAAPGNVAERMRIDPIGNIGIGTTAPSSKLQVAGTVTATAFVGSGAGLTGVTGTDSTKVAKSGDTMTGALNLPANGLVLGTNQLVASGGNVGIGTAAPGAKLEVAGSVKTSGEFQSTNNFALRQVQGNYGFMHYQDGTNYYMLTTNSGDQYGAYNTLRPFYVGLATGNLTLGSGAMTVIHAGNVGIGTAGPTEKLEVNGNIKMTAANPVLSSGGSYISIPNGIYSSSGTAPSYFEGPLMVRNVLQNDSGAALTIGGGTSGLTNFNGPIAITTAGNLTMGGNAVIDGNGGWHRTYGGTGWYNSTYGGGFNMTDATYIRAYGSKGLYVAAPTIVNTPGLTAYGGPDAYGVVGQPSVTGYGGVIGFTQDGSKFGILGHANAYSFLGVGPIYNVGEIQSTSGGFRFPDGTLQTTASTSAGAACGGYNHLQVWLIKNSNCNVSVYQCLNGTSTLLNTFGGMATGACY